MQKDTKFAFKRRRRFLTLIRGEVHGLISGAAGRPLISL
jgi:hypothetical protein